MMRCPHGALVTRTNGPVCPLTSSAVAAAKKKKVDPRPPALFSIQKGDRCGKTLSNLKRIDAKTITGDCPEHKRVDMSSAIWSSEAGL